jgi:alpha-L-fucosidase
MVFLKEQIRELCTQYGEIHGIWWDMNVTGRVDPSINEMIRSLQPKAVISNRGLDDGDFSTPEREYDKSVDEVLAFEKPTQAIQAVGRESWGYKEDEDYYTDRHLIRQIDNILAKGGTYVLNSSVKPDGTIVEEDTRILHTIGNWYHTVKEALEDVEPASHLTDNRDVLLTKRGNNLYVHLTKEPVLRRVLLKPIDTLPRKATLLNTGEEVEVRVDLIPTEAMDRSVGRRVIPPKNYLRIRNLPVNELNNTVLVVKLEFDDLVTMEPTPSRTSEQKGPWVPGE